MKKILTIWIPIICLHILVYALLTYMISAGRDRTLYIALAASLEEPNGKDIVNAVELYLDWLNASGGIDGRRIQLRVFDDQNQVALAQKIAETIAADKKILLVLGHSASDVSLAAGKEYDQKGVPAITAEATADSVTKNNPWYFRVIPNNSIRADSASNYLQLTLHRSSASIVYDARPRWTALADRFRNSASRWGLSVKGVWKYDPDDADLENRLESIVQSILKMDDPGVLFLMTDSKEGGQIIRKLKDAGRDDIYFASEAFSDPSFAQEMKQHPKEAATPGYYTDGIYCPLPYVSPVAEEIGRSFQKAFRKRFLRPPPSVSAYYFDAVHVAVEAIRKAGIHGRGQIRSDRKKIRDALAGFYDKDHAVKGITGSIHFDKNGDFNRPMTIGIFQQQHLLPAFLQYRPVKDLSVVTDLFEQVLQGEYLIIDRELMSRYKLVHVGGKLNHLGDLDISRSRCAVDMDIWFRYEGEFDFSEIDFPNAVAPVRLTAPIAEKKEGDVTTRIYHVAADFWTDFDLSRFPFSSYRIPVRLRHIARSDVKMVHIPNLAKISGLSPPAAAQAQPEDRQLRGWNISDVSYYREELLQDVGKGTAAMVIGGEGTSFTQLDVDIQLKPSNFLGMYWAFLPFVALLVLLYAVFTLPVGRFGARMGIVILAILDNTLLHLRLLNFIPLAFATTVDQIVLGTYLVILLAGIFALVVEGEAGSANSIYSRRLLSAGKMLYPLGIVSLSFAWMLLMHRP